MAGVLKSIGAGLRSGAKGLGAAKNAGTAFKTSGSSALKPKPLLGGSKGGSSSFRTVKRPTRSSGKKVALHKPSYLENPKTGKRVSLPDKYSGLRGTIKKSDLNRAKAKAAAKRTQKSAGKPGKLEVVRPKIVEFPDPKKAAGKSKSLQRPRPGVNIGARGSLPGSAVSPYGDTYAGMSPQAMRQAGFGQAADFAEDAQQKANSPFAANRPQHKSVSPSSSGGKWGLKMPDFSMNIDGRNRVDAEDRRFINEQRDKTHRHKREQFEWEQAPKDRKADRHWNLINTGKVVYKDGRANSDSVVIARELHRDRSLESFERKFNREWQNRLQSKPYASLSPEQQKVARDDLYARMRRNHDRTYSVGRSIAGWRADRKAEKKQRKEDERNLRNIRMIRGWY